MALDLNSLDKKISTEELPGNFKSKRKEKVVIKRQRTKKVKDEDLCNYCLYIDSDECKTCSIKTGYLPGRQKPALL